MNTVALRDERSTKFENPWQPVYKTEWRFIQVKGGYTITLGKMLHNESTSSEDVEVPYLKSQHVQWDKVVLQDLPTMWASPWEIENLTVRSGDLLVCEGGDVGRASIVSGTPPENCIIQNALHLVRARRGNSTHFLRYLLQHASSNKWFEVLCNRATIAHFTVDKFSQMYIWLPLPDKQHRIADYLDRETQKIDSLIAAKKRLLELLAEKRRSMITQAVTRGLAADVPMKDSGVEWLGKIPQHWLALPIKFLCESLQTGPFGSQLHAEDYVDGGIPSINPAHLSMGEIVADLQVSVDQATAERLSVHQLHLGDVVFARRGEMGRCGLVTAKEVGWLCGSGSLRTRPRKNVLNSKYLVLVMLNTFASKWLSLMSVGTTMDNLNTEIIGALEIPVPPLEEQDAICSRLEKRIANLEQLKTVAQKTIALLQERRTSLISAAVTGQLQIPD